MASSIVHQGLQSCLEPQVIESFVLRQTLSPPPPPPPKIQEFNKSGWSFLQALENPSSMASKINNLDNQESNEVYVHPMVKRSASALSKKSLEMCTEGLGSETGSEGSENGDEICALSMEERERVRRIQRSKFQNFDRKISCRSEFPPPLTSISGSDGTVNVRHHREGGRLVIKAVSFANCGTKFQTERTNGRLKLSLLRGCSVNYESERVENEIEQYEEGGEVESDDEEEEEEEKEEEVVAVADADAEEEEEEDGVGGGGGGGGCRWDMDGNRWKVAGKGDLRRLTRCKEGGNGNKIFAHWGNRTYWVAIS